MSRGLHPRHRPSRTFPVKVRGKRFVLLRIPRRVRLCTIMCVCSPHSTHRPSASHRLCINVSASSSANDWSRLYDDGIPRDDDAITVAILEEVDILRAQPRGSLRFSIGAETIRRVNIVGDGVSDLSARESPEKRTASDHESDRI